MTVSVSSVMSSVTMSVGCTPPISPFSSWSRSTRGSTSSAAAAAAAATFNSRRQLSCSTFC